MTEPTVRTFLYGSYMNLDILGNMRVHPSHVEVARLRGFDIRIAPHANLIVSEHDLVYGILVTTTHHDLDRLYRHTEAALGSAYQAEAVLVETSGGFWRPAMCYISHTMRSSPPSADYVTSVVQAAVQHDFPAWYIDRISRHASDSEGLIDDATPHQSPIGEQAASLDLLRVPSVQRQRLDFVLAAHGLTTVNRLNRLLDGSRAESSAEHSWHLALTALALAPDVAAEVDLARVVAMLLIHDLPEVDAGDVPIYDEAARVAVVTAEQQAAARIFALLPAHQGEDLLALWREFERGETNEARFAKAIDRLQPLLLHWAGDGAVWAERRVTVDQERRLMAVIEQYWPALAPIATALIDNAHQRGLLPAYGN